MLFGITLGVLLGITGATASIKGVSSLRAAAPATDLGKNASPAFSEDQVNATGAFSYKYPLSFPKGRFDVKPMVSLSYSSDAPLRGGVAAGWALSVPMVRGDNSRGTLDANGNNPSTERYVSTLLGGGSLMRDSDAPIDGETGDIFLVMHDNAYVRYERVSPDSGAQEGVLWRARTSDGMVYEFGQHGLHSYDRAPLLRQIDPYGNVLLRYDWSRVTENMAGGEHIGSEWILEGVEYLAVDGTVYAQVDLSYSRGFCSGKRLPIGVALDYHSGEARMRGSRRLDRIRVRALRPEQIEGELALGDALRDVRIYDLDYSAETESCEFNSGAPLRRLDFVQETAYAPVTQIGTVLPATHFDYGEFDAEKTRYEPRAFSGLTLSKGADQQAYLGSHSAVTELLMDINGDGLQDRVYRDAGESPSNNNARIEFGTGHGFDSTNALTVKFPGFLPFSSSSVTGYEDLSLGLSGNVKYYADNTALYVRQGCGMEDSGLPPLRHGNKERFGFYDVNHDGLPDAVTELRYETKWVRDTSLPQAPVASAGEPSFGIKAINDPWTNPDVLCNLDAPTSTERWPVWKVRYNLGTEFSSTIDVIAAPLPLAAISPELSVGAPVSSPVALEQVVRPPPGTNEPVEAIVGSGDLNGDGFGPDAFVREYRNTCVEGDQRDHCQGQAYYGYVCATEGDGSSCFFVRQDGELSPVNQRQVVLKNSAGEMERVSGIGWYFPGLFHTSLVIEAKPSFNYHTFTTNTLVTDVHGDGLPDLLTRGQSGDPSGLLLYPNQAQGWAETPITLQPGSNRLISRTEMVVLEGGGSQPRKGVANHEWILVDLNNDGLLDQVDLSRSNEVRIHTNYGLGFDVTRRFFNLTDSGDQGRLEGALASFTRMNEIPEPERHWRKWGAFVDMTGDGLKDMVVWNQHTRRYELHAAVVDDAPHRLVGIDNGRGGLTRIEYASTADPEVVAQGEYQDEWHAVRNPRWVVKRIEVDPGSDQPAMVTDYAYLYPVYTPDLYGRYGLRGFRELVKIGPSGASKLSRYDYDQFYGGLLSETVTYRAEDSDLPHQIETREYEGLPVLHDTDPAMFPGKSAHNWHLVDQTTHHCPAQAPGQSEAEDHCRNEGQVQQVTQEWMTLNYRGDGISGAVPVTRLVRKRYKAHDDGFGQFRRVRDSMTYAYKSDADEYIVQEATVGSNDYSLNHPDLGRNVGYLRRVWTNQLRELRLAETRAHVWSSADRKSELTQIKGPYFTYNPDGTVRHERTAQDRSMNLQSAGTYVYYDSVGVTETERRRQVIADSNATPTVHQVKTITDIGTGATLLTEGPNPSERKRVEVDGLGRPLAQYETVDDGSGGYEEVLMASYRYADYPEMHQLGLIGPRMTEERRVGTDGLLTTHTVFDGLGREIYQGVVENGQLGLEIPTDYFWDEAGDLVRVDVPDPRSLNGDDQVSYQFTYDSLKRLLTVRGPEDQLLASTRYEGSLVSIVTEQGEEGAPAAVKRLVKNPADQLIQVQELLDDGQWATTEYRYDGNGSLEQIVDPEGVVTRLLHDSEGRRVRIESGDRVWTYAYDAGDNLIEITSPHPAGEAEAYTTRMAYDSLDRMVRKTPALADLSSAEQAVFAIGAEEYVYDVPHPDMEDAHNVIGRLGYSTGPVVGNRFRYDAQGRVIEQHQTLKVPGLSQASGTTLLRSNGYNPDGTPRTVAMTDESLDNVIAAPLTYSHDFRGLPEGLEYGGEHLVQLNRNSVGAVVERVLQPQRSSSLSASYEYDALGRMAALAVTASDGSQPYSQYYDYYANSQVAQITEQVAGAEQRSMMFEWDTRHQLIVAEQDFGDPGYNGFFGYGPAGRLESVEVALDVVNPDTLEGVRVTQRQVEYRYDTTDPQRLNQLLDLDGSVYADYQYDAAGNVIRRTLGGESWDLRYDGENRLRKVVHRAGESNDSETFYYEGPNRVLAVRSDGRLRRWFGDAELRYRDAGAAFEKSWYTAKLGQPVARIENGDRIEYTVQTPQGHEALSMTLDTETGHTRVQVGKLYGPFGEVLYGRLGPGKQAEDYTKEFNGKDYDHLSGLHYYGHRYYDPVALQWNRADPKFRFAPDAAYDEPRRMNLYAYTLHNPISLVDPDGLNPAVVSMFIDVSTEVIANSLSEGTLDSIQNKILEVVTTFGRVRSDALERYNDAVGLRLSQRLNKRLNSAIMKSSFYQDGNAMKASTQQYLGKLAQRIGKSLVLHELYSQEEASLSKAIKAQIKGNGGYDDPFDMVLSDLKKRQKEAFEKKKEWAEVVMLGVEVFENTLENGDNWCLQDGDCPDMAVKDDSMGRGE
jgi:RHS repeat-associated protein